ncbi:MAG TPA: LamG domain-containing protein [Actinoallomurus sp.]
MIADLVLHWPLDEVAPGRVVADSSGNHHDGAVEGAPGNPPDERLGSCLSLDGVSDALTFGADSKPASMPAAYTAEAWINLTRPERIGVVMATPDGFSLSVDAHAAVHHSPPAVSKAESVTAPDTLKWGAWHHVAVTYDGTTARTYLEGVQVAETVVGSGPVLTGKVLGRPAVPEPAPAAVEPPSGLVVGRDALRPGNRLAGLLAHVRIYAGALTAKQILLDLATDESALAAFVRTYPLAFELANAGGQHVLYIDDAPAGQALTLRVTNASRQTLELRGPAGTASAEDHHLALRLRASTLTAGVQPVLATDGWSMARADDRDGTVLYLLGPADTTIVPGGWLDLTLTGMNADGAGGSRGTRVELSYRRLGQTGESTELTGVRTQFLDIVNHRGRPDIPLDVGFTGGDRVLSDEVTPSALRLRLTNVSRDIGLAISGTGSAGVASAFIISFDLQLAGESRGWALIKADAADGADLTLDPPADDGAGWSVVKENLGQRLQWTLTPRADQTLPPGASLSLTLAGLHALASPGHAPIVVAHRNIPGYQDGFVSLAVQRTPLLFTAANAGIGTATPQARLHIVGAGDDDGALLPGGYTAALALGPAQRPSLLMGVRAQDAGVPQHGWVQSAAGPLVLNPTGNDVGIGTASPQGRLHILGTESDANGGTLLLGPADRSNLRLGNHRDYSWIQSHTSKPLAINPIGNNVGIGTTTAAARLTVGSSSDHLQLRRDTGGTGGVLFLELYQNDTTGGPFIFPNIRFHHSKKFWHRIEARPEGLYLKTGDLNLNDLAALYAKRVTVDEIAIGDTTIGLTELRLLKRLALGQLELRLYNTTQNEYAYAGDYSPFDNDRRHVFTWRPKTNGIGQLPDNSVWRLSLP